jgi:hypothetical protein
VTGPANVTFNAVFNARSALRVIQQLQNGLNVIAGSQRASLALTRNTSSATSNLISNVIKLTAAWTGVRSVIGAIGAGLEFNKIIESSKLGIASLITAEADLRDEHGKLLKGTEALAAAQGLAGDQLNKLRIAGIRTAATTEELVTAFQEAVGAGVSVGLTLDQIRKFTVQVAQAATTINLPFNQLNQEVRSILQGTIDRNSRIAKALQLTNAQVNQAKQQNKLADLLEEKFKAFTIAGEEVVKTWAALGSNIRDAIQLLSGEVTRPLFTQVRDTALAALGQIFDFDRAEIREQFRGLINGFKVVFGEAGAILSQAINAAVGSAASLSVWLDKNKKAVQDTVTAVGTLIREFAGLVSDVISVALGMAKSSVASGSMADHIRVATGFVRFLRDHIDGVVLALEAMIASQLVAAAIVNPIGAAVAGVILLIGWLNRLKGAHEVARDEYNRTIDTFGRNVAEAVRLGEEYIALGRQIDQGKLKGQELTDALAQLASIQDRLIRSDERFRTAFSKTGETYDQVGQKIRNVTQDQLSFLDASIKTLQAQQKAGDVALEKLGAKREGPIIPFAGESPAAFSARQKQVAAIRAELDQIAGSLSIVQAAAASTFREIDKAERELRQVTIEAKEGANKARNLAALKDAVDAAKARLKTAEATAKEETKIEKAKFDLNLISALEFYGKTRDLQLAALNREQEVANLELKLAQLKSDPGEIAKAKEHQERVENTRREVIEQANLEILAASRAFAKQRREIDTEILTFGDRDDQLIARVRKITEQYRDALEKAFKNKDFSTVLKISRLIDLKTAKEQFDLLKDIAASAEADLQNQIAKIQLQFQTGVIGEPEAQRRFAAILGTTSSKLAGVVLEMEKLRPLLKDDPAFIEFLNSINQRVVELATDAALAADGMLKIKQAFRQALESGLTNFFADIGDKAKDAASLFREFANSVISDMKRIIAQVIASRILQVILGTAGAGSRGNITQSGGKALGGPAGSSAPRRGTGGGLMEGPGTTTSDDIPLLWVSRKEYVEPAHVVDWYGAGVFEAMRQKKIPRDFMRLAMAGITGATLLSRSGFRNRFAEGGAVSMAATARANATQGQQARIPVDLNVGVDREGILRVWRGRIGRDVVLGHVAQNPNAIEKLTSHALKR